jgi:D-galactarolactone isomerase
VTELPPTAVPFPPGSCDTHLHFYDKSFPTDPRAVLHPPDADPDDYRRFRAELGLERLVVVQPTTYGLDNRCQLQAAASFGDDVRSVVVVDTDITEAELRQFTEQGARGARFHMLSGGVVPWSMLDEVARRIAPHGWHIQLQLNGRELEQRFSQLARLPVDVVVDHVGRFMPPVEPTDPGFTSLLSLLDTGSVWVKLSAPYESSVAGPPGYDDLDPTVDALVSRAPDRLLWASNWPHPGQDRHPSAADLRRLLEHWIPDADTRHRVLVDNPAELYAF